MSITWVVEANENKNKENANEKNSCLSIIWVVNTNEKKERKKERRGNNNKSYLCCNEIKNQKQTLYHYIIIFCITMVSKRMTKMRRVVMITMLLLLSTKHAHGRNEWDCTGASNTGTFQRSTGCTISGTATDNGGGVVVTNTLEIVGTVEDMNNLIVLTAPSKQRHFYINGANDKLVLRYLKLVGGGVYSNISNYINVFHIY